MKDFIDQAAINGIELIASGPCQFCGAHMERGIFECYELANSVVYGLDLSDPAQRIVRFMSVDAHALQHPEIHGRWSNHFHLTRLRLVLGHNVSWRYEDSSRLSTILNQHKLARAEEVLAPPSHRGSLTTEQLRRAGSGDPLAQFIRSWAEEVHSTWGHHHDLLEPIVDEFLATR